jgi:hypothetical protein
MAAVAIGLLLSCLRVKNLAITIAVLPVATGARLAPPAQNMRPCRQFGPCLHGRLPTKGLRKLDLRRNLAGRVDPEQARSTLW